MYTDASRAHSGVDGLGLGELLGLGGGHLGLAAELGLPAVLVDDPEGEDEEPRADDGADRHGDEVEPERVAPVDARVDVRAADDDAAGDEELVDDEVVEARRDEELDREPDHDELGDGLRGNHLEPDREADHPVAADAADERRAPVLRALAFRGLDELAHVGVGEAVLRAEVGVEVGPERAAVRVRDHARVLDVARVEVAVDLEGLDEARLPGEDDEVEDGADDVHPPADEPVDERALDLLRAVLGRGREAREGAEHVVGRDELAALAEDDEREAERDAEAGEDEVVDADGRAPAAADLAGHEDPEREQKARLEAEEHRHHGAVEHAEVDDLADVYHKSHDLGLRVEDALDVDVRVLRRHGAGLGMRVGVAEDLVLRAGHDCDCGW
mmetsp:Transcript_17381/g.52893  ORF Transcript_17381/g.52893 Transcript_17381/m.52893 type:complete len:386 (-) Transcript_17381:79-1236(-)